MIKKLKKLLGICEHRWIIAECNNTRLCHGGRWDGLQFTVKIICENCGTHKRVESEYFDEISISSDSDYLSGTKYWINANDCEEALIKKSNAKIVWNSFAIKCKKKYNVDIKAKFN